MKNLEYMFGIFKKKLSCRVQVKHTSSKVSLLKKKILAEKNKNKKIVSIVITHAGQQTYFEDVVKLSMKQEGNKFFILVCDYQIEDNEKIDIFKNIDAITTQEYKNLCGIDIALHSEIHCRSLNVSQRCFAGHGFFGKHTIFTEENLKSFNHYFLYGPRDRELIKFMAAGEENKISHIRFWETGYPKYDKLFETINNYEPPKKIRNSFPTILYAPAWDPGGSLRKYKDNIFKTLAELKNINVIVKLHPASLVSQESPEYSFLTGGVNWRQVLESFEEKYPNFVFYREQDITPLTKYCKLVITDFSSVSFGFLMLEKPVVVIDCQEFYNKTLESWGEDGSLSKSHPLFNNGRDYSNIINSIYELPNLVPKLLGSRSASPKLVDDLLYNPGGGTIGMLKAINDILEYKYD